MRKSKNEFDGNVDALFKLPLAEFTGARNALAAQLKKNGQGDEAADVKALGKPPVSAWAVNQLYWNYRQAFDNLIASGERFHKAQSSRSGAKVADMRASLDARREALTKLSDLAAQVLRDAGHNPAPDTIHRITTTLEGISAYASRADGPPVGRLTHDVDPPGFESFGSFVPVAGEKQKADGRKQKAVTKQRPKDDESKIEEEHKGKVAAAKASLQDAKRSLNEARARAQRLESTQKHAEAGVKLAEKRLKEARAAAEEATSMVKDAERTVEKATKELESLS